jgi:uncharacterized Tic20 family protein
MVIRMDCYRPILSAWEGSEDAANQNEKRLLYKKRIVMKEIIQLSESERNWAMLCHLSAFAGFFFPFGGIIGPLIFWLTRKDESHWVDWNGKGSLNFQISMLLYMVLAIPLCIIIVGIPIIIFIGILKVICIIIASVRSAKGEEFRYPLSIPFIQ